MNLSDIARDFGTDTNSVRSYFDADPNVTLGSDSDELSEDVAAYLSGAWAEGENSEDVPGDDSGDDSEDVPGDDSEDVPVYAA